MLQKRTIGIVGLIAVVLVGVLAWQFGLFAPRDVQGQVTEPLVQADLFVKEGYILNGHPELKPESWYLVHSQEGEQAKAAELRFTTSSICVGSKASGICRPDLFVNERPAKVEGVWEGDVLVVRTLTFVQAQ